MNPYSRSLLPLILAGSAIAQPASPSILLHDLVGPLDDGNSGYAVSSAGDVDGDGLADIVVGAPGWAPFFVVGSARVYSGLDGSLLYTFTGTSLDDRFGFSVAGAGE
jgi:hypothetical protein